MALNEYTERAIKLRSRPSCCVCLGWLLFVAASCSLDSSPASDARGADAKDTLWQPPAAETSRAVRGASASDAGIDAATSMTSTRMVRRDAGADAKDSGVTQPAAMDAAVPR